MSTIIRFIVLIVLVSLKGTVLGTESTRGHGAEIDNTVVSPDSDLEDILESEIIFNGDIAEKAEGIHPYDKQWEQEEENEDEDEMLNTNEDDDIYQGDISTEESNVDAFTKRSFVADLSFENGKLWPQGIVPYLINESSYANSLDTFHEKLAQAKALFSKETCIQWKPWTEDLATELGHRKYVTFINGKGCTSPVGVSKGKINLSLPGCRLLRSFIHEMCHTLGMDHEHNRSDRNRYMKINWHNLKDDKGFAFLPVRTINIDSLDLHSVMQYGTTSFSRNKKKTIELREKVYGFLTTTYRDFSFYDIGEINQVYRCSANCSRTIKCNNFGFVNHNCTCRCPDGLAGTHCDEIDGNCGGILDLESGQDEIITSPGWPSKYQVNLTCVWLIRAPKNHRVKITINGLNVAKHRRKNRCYHWLEVKSYLIGDPGIKFCGQLWEMSKAHLFHSINNEANVMMIKFDSIYANDRAPKQGFNLNVQAFRSGCLSMPCKTGGTCHEGDNDFTYRCSCFPGYSGRNCEIVQGNAVVKCNMEIDFGVDCFLALENEQKEWVIDNSVKGINANEGGVFAKLKDKTASLVSIVKFEGRKRCLTFDYYIKQRSKGRIEVYYKNNARLLGRKVFRASQMNVDRWVTANVQIPYTRNLKIILKGVKANKRLVAIDNVILRPGQCGFPCKWTNPCLNDGVCIPSNDSKTFSCQCVNGYIGEICETATNKTVYTCNFEPNSNCFLTQSTNDYFDWSVNEVKESNAGFIHAAEGRHYTYLNTSSANRGNKAIYTNKISDFPVIDRCLTFNYWVDAPGVGTLNVKTGDAYGLNKVVWSVMRNQGSNWWKASVYLPADPGFNIFIEGVAGRSKTHYIGMDNFILRPGSCDLTCSFEDDDGDCFLCNEAIEQNHWAINQGETSTRITGPRIAKEGSKFLYMNVSSMRRGDRARLLSFLTLPAAQRCLFFYHQIRGNALLRVYVTSGKVRSESRISLHQGSGWIMKYITLPRSSKLKIVFEGIPGSTLRSGIALDDIQLKEGKCVL